MAYFDENGNEVSGLMTQDEVDARVSEAQTAAKAEFEAKEAESNQKIGELNAELAKVNAAINEEGNNNQAGVNKDTRDENLAALRKKQEETEAALAAEKAKSEERIANLEKSRVSDIIKGISGDDTELAMKVQKHYDETLASMAANTDEEIKLKVNAAFKLSADASQPSPLDNAMSGGSAGLGINSGAADTVRPFTENEKSLGEKLGISDADREKYGKNLRNK